MSKGAMDRAICPDKWVFDEEYDCWRLDDVVYALNATAPEYQMLSIYAPRDCMNADGTPRRKDVPVVFENCAGGYMQKHQCRLGDPFCFAEQYLKHGLVYISCACRGRETVDANGVLIGKSPATLVDFKTAIRFLRHNAAALPGDFDRIISVGCSAGGAMSTLLGVTGDHAAYDEYLRETGAYMDESDSVFASQIYCPIIDLEHADLAYEWCFAADKICEDSHAGPAETMSPFKEALSKQLSAQYISYINSLELRHPETGEALILGQDGRSGAFYDYLMDQLSASATKFLRMQGDKAAEYADGKQAWLLWDGDTAKISDLDTYVLSHRRRMKPCTSFDKLDMDSGENHVFGDVAHNYKHFDADIAAGIAALREQFPDEYAKYHDAFAAVAQDGPQKKQVWLFNPHNFIGTQEKCAQAQHFRIRVGAKDADTSFTISMALAIRLANAGCGSVDYAMVWDQPHCQADYPGEVLEWIDRICAK